MDPLRIDHTEPRRSDPSPRSSRSRTENRQARQQQPAALDARKQGSCIAARFEAAGLAPVPQLLAKLSTLLLRNAGAVIPDTPFPGAGPDAASAAADAADPRGDPDAGPRISPPAGSTTAAASRAEAAISESVSLRLIDEALEMLHILASNRASLEIPAIKAGLQELVQQILGATSREFPAPHLDMAAQIRDALAGGDAGRISLLLGDLEADILDRLESLALLRDSTDPAARAGRPLLELVRALGEREEPPFLYSEIAWRIGEETVPVRLLAEWRRRGSKPGVKRIIIDLEMPELGRVRCEIRAEDSRLDLLFTVDDENTRSLFAAEIGHLAGTLEDAGFSVQAVVSENATEPAGLLSWIFPGMEGEAEKGELDIHA